VLNNVDLKKLIGTAMSKETNGEPLRALLLFQ